MKAAILILALVAITASVAYAAPSENADTELNALSEIMKETKNELEGVEMQDDNENKNERDQEAEIEALLEMAMKQVRYELEDAQMQNDDDEIEAALQEFFAKEHIPLDNGL